MDTNKKDKILEYKNRQAVGGVFVIRNRETGKQLLLSTKNLQGSKNQFQFAVMTGSCVKPQVQKDWERFGSGVFLFEVLEEVKQKETQSAAEFAEEIALLEELWREKLPGDTLY